MPAAPVIAAALAATYALNIPFGYWRRWAKKRRSRLQWFAAIHAPVPLIAAMRIAIGVPITLIPVFVAAFAAGQFTGGKLQEHLESRLGETTRCLPCDMMKLVKPAK